jgi:hypothetical protein
MGGTGANQTPWMTIVGVGEETSYSLWDKARPANVYMHAAQLPRASMTYSIVTNNDSLAVAPAVRKAMAAFDRTLPLDVQRPTPSLCTKI